MVSPGKSKASHKSYLEKIFSEWNQVSESPQKDFGELTVTKTHVEARLVLTLEDFSGLA